ncbi:MAG: TIGR03087 family PEP-CTERM/XrtA system glycosyltransferase [Phycisphaeraceae bacterium]
MIYRLPDRETHPTPRRKPSLLVLTHRVPCPPDRGDRIRAYHLIKGLAEAFDLTLAAVADEPITPATLVHLESMVGRVLLSRSSPTRRHASAARALVTGKAITPAAMYDPSLAKSIARLHRLRPFDTVLTYCTGMIGYVKALREAVPQHDFRHVLDLVDVDSRKWADYAESTRGPMRLIYQAEARRLRAVEAGDVVPFDALTVISDAESSRYRETVTDRHAPVVVNNGVDLDRFAPADEPAAKQPTNSPTIAFTGVMSYRPNVEAVRWFAERIMPIVRDAHPDARFEIIGKSPTPAVAALDSLPGVRVVGAVADTAEYLRRASLAVAPMRTAPGVQNKVLEAMACGLPVVCSPPAASGIDAQVGRDLVVADGVDATASACSRLLADADERRALGRAARRRVETRYRWSVTIRPMLDLLRPATRPPLAQSA